MGKLYYDLYPRVCHPLNLYAAYKQAARGKRSRPDVSDFEYHLEEQLISLEEELAQETYLPGGYRNFEIHTPKQRLISAAPFRDRVVHHALMNVIEPLFERQFIYDSYANRKKKGTHRALDRCTYFLRRYGWVMHLDVCQYFPSIDHRILRAILAQTLGDQAVLRLVDEILSSGAGVQADEYDMVYFPGDDLFAANRPRGLPIGNLTSQHWANVYLNQLDQFAKRMLKCKAYVRYVDDVLLFAHEKSELNEWRNEIIHYLESLRLTIHANQAQPIPVERGAPFLGFIVFPDHRRLKQRNGIAFRRRLKSLANKCQSGEIEAKDLKASLQGWINHARYGDTWGLRRAVLASAGIAME